jgi:O-antigen ligase
MNDAAEELAPLDGEMAPVMERSTGRLRFTRPSLSARLVSGLEIWRSGVAYAVALLTPLIAYVGNLGFAPLAALAGIAALVFLGRKSAPSLGVGLLALLMIWGLVSMSWSPAMPLRPDFHSYRTVQALTGIKLALELGLYASFVMAMRDVSEETAARASLFMAIGLTVLAALLLIECLDGAALYQWIKARSHHKTRPDLALRNVARGCYVAAVLFWPAVLRLRQAHQPLALWVFVLGLAAAACVFRVDSPILALILAAGAFYAVKAWGRGVIWGLIAATTVYFAAAPLVAHLATGILHPHELPGNVGKQSWAVRLDIWRFASMEVLANPWLGWGLDASRAWPKDIPLHTHDAALQVWLELGALGALLTALFWGWLFSRIAVLVELDREMGAAAAASAVAYLAIGALSFGVWQEWWLGVGAVAIVLCGFVAAARRNQPVYEQGLTALQPLG